MKTKDWSKLPHFPVLKTTGETKWVNPETFFDELPAVIKVLPMPGEEALYTWIGSVLEAAATAANQTDVNTWLSRPRAR